MRQYLPFSALLGLTFTAVVSEGVPAEVFPPGEFLREELEAREWSQQELADILDRPPRLISEIIAGKRAITPETAKGLADAFGMSPDYWMNLESQYQLSKVKLPNDNVARKARLYDKFPVREMLRRGWVRASENVDVLEQRFCAFFSIPDMSEETSDEETIEYGDIGMWTFYKLATRKGYVDIRFYGSSNGYYSVGVNLYVDIPE